MNVNIPRKINFHEYFKICTTNCRIGDFHTENLPSNISANSAFSMRNDLCNLLYALQIKEKLYLELSKYTKKGIANKRITRP